VDMWLGERSSDMCLGERCEEVHLMMTYDWESGARRS
jgi:hypothetical protein